jgi:hypothetical protein
MNLQFWNDVADLLHWRFPATCRDCCYRLHRIHGFLPSTQWFFASWAFSFGEFDFAAFLEGCDNGRNATVDEDGI